MPQGLGVQTVLLGINCFVVSDFNQYHFASCERHTFGAGLVKLV